MVRDRIHTDGGVETTTDPWTATATDLDGQIALVAGGTDGIGKATATRLAELGATTGVVGSTPERGQKAVQEIVEESDNDAVEYVQADFSLMSEVEQMAKQFREAHDRLDVLVHTAGIVPYEQEMTEEGIERSFAINYLSRFLLTNLLVDLLEGSAPARVVNVAAAGQNPVDELDLDDLRGDRLFNDPGETDYFARGQGALNQAQVANEVFSLELAERVEGVGVTVVNPGAVDTDIRLKADETWRETDEMIRSEMGVVSPGTVAETVVPLATTTDPSGISGRFFETGREEIDVPDGVDDPELRQRLWELSAQLSGLADNE
ncbi:MAG: SDR family NAD(P)-dependent oxidoreductase [Halobacteriales archaeon]